MCCATLASVAKRWPCFASAIELDPRRAESHCNLGNVLFEFGRFDEAVASFRRALALSLITLWPI